MDKSSKGLYTIIGEGSSFEGKVSVPHSIRIDGSFKGEIEVEDVLTIGSNAVVEANVTARSIVVGGTFVGNMIATERIEMNANSSVTGDLTTKDLIIDDGAYFEGRSLKSNKKQDII